MESSQPFEKRLDRFLGHVRIRHSHTGGASKETLLALDRRVGELPSNLRRLLETYDNQLGTYISPSRNDVLLSGREILARLDGRDPIVSVPVIEHDGDLNPDTGELRALEIVLSAPEGPLVYVTADGLLPSTTTLGGWLDEIADEIERFEEPPRLVFVPGETWTPVGRPTIAELERFPPGTSFVGHRVRRRLESWTLAVKLDDTDWVLSGAMRRTGEGASLDVIVAEACSALEFTTRRAPDLWRLSATELPLVGDLRQGHVSVEVSRVTATGPGDQLCVLEGVELGSTSIETFERELGAMLGAPIRFIETFRTLADPGEPETGGRLDTIVAFRHTDYCPALNAERMGRGIRWLEDAVANHPWRYPDHVRDRVAHLLAHMIRE